MKKKLSADYAKSADKLLKKIQQAGIDPFGFGLSYRATHAGEAAWQQWQSIYPTLPIAVNARIKIEGTGLIK
ncbi:Ger(x)C family spore germination C-terminal domain-containing protein [Paenibacillus algorifonticola]|uniref:Ger(x)C family spore germination C-terminal domain-containing protein n=1 Tax=Paenibacillus algorifonticola TaxID=684063 RepID=UPI000619A0F6|nr:Ger(x)C family spore germination C-terminal domain-containing protein [Paenibacillus algorifonticola]